MRNSQYLDSNHQSKQSVLRLVGPIVLLTGFIFTAIGMGSFFSSFGSIGAGPPRYFWCCFVGMPLMALGMGICKFAFLGTVTRYVANETAPVGKDVVNYMADGTQDAVRTMASAVADGLTGREEVDSGLPCGSCGEENDADARFCKNCGVNIVTELRCQSCGETNDSDARYCDACGHQISS